MTLRSNLLLLLFLLLAGLQSHREALFEHEALIDEEFYEAGVTALELTGSAYTAEGFMYPPTFAAGGLWLQQRFGVEDVRYAVRWLNFACLIFLLWFAVQCYVQSGASGPRVQTHHHVLWLIAVAVILVRAPGVHLGMYVGNISFLVGTLLVLGFWFADRKPVLAGATLGLSLLIKPLAAGSLPLLLLKPGNSADGLPAPTIRRRWLAAAVAGFSSLLVLWFFRSELPPMLATEMTSMAQNRSMSFYRVSRLLGLSELRLPIFTITLLALCAGLWSRLETRRKLLAGALVMVPLTTLAVWSHTLILFFPVCALALRRLVDRRTALPSSPNSIRWLKRPSCPKERMELVLVLGGLLLVYFVHSGGYPQLHPLLQILLLTPPLLAPLGLTAYWFSTSLHAGSSDAESSSLV